MGKQFHKRFWFLNILCLALYLWTTTESTRFSVRVEAGACLATAADRFLKVPCPFTAVETHVGLYNLLQRPDQPLVELAPLDLLLPPLAWAEVDVSWAEGARPAPVTMGEPGLVTWSGLRQRWRALMRSEPEHIYVDLPVDATAFAVDVRLWRPHARAGLVIAGADGTGLVFISEDDSRLGAWWTFAAGQPHTPLVAIPLEKTVTSRFQTLLRQILWAQQGGLLLLAVAWLPKLRRLGQPRRTRWPAARFKPEAVWVVGSLCLAVFAFSLWFAAEVLEGAPHFQDSVAYLFQAETLARGRLWTEAPPLPQFFDHEFLLIKDGRWFGKYPPGWPALLAIGAGLDLPWLINPLLAALSVALLYRLGRDLFGGRTAILTALLLAGSPLFLFMSGSLMAHSAELFWVMVFLLSWTGAVNGGAGKGRHRYALAAGLALGAVLLTRQLTAVVVCIPFAGLTFLNRRRVGPAPDRLGWVRVLGTALPGLLAAAGILLLYQALLTGSPVVDPRLLDWPHDRLGFAADIGDAGNVATLAPFADTVAITWQFDPGQPPRGHTPARGLFNLARNWRSLLVNLFGWPPLFTLGFAWLALFRRRPAGIDFVLLITALGLAGAYIFYWHAGLAYGPRYLYATLPFWILLTARGIELLAAAVGRRPVLLLVGALLAGNLLLNLPLRLDDFEDYNFIDPAPRYAAEQAAATPALIFVPASEGAWWTYGAFFPGNDPELRGPVLFARDLGAENDALRALYSDRNNYYLTDKGLQPLE